MATGYSDTKPELMVSCDDKVQLRYNIEQHDPDDDHPDGYWSYDYVMLNLEVVTSPLVMYYSAVAEKIDSVRALDEQIGILRKFVAGLSAQVEALAAACGKTLPDNDYKKIFGEFHTWVEDLKLSTKQDLGLVEHEKVL